MMLILVWNDYMSWYLTVSQDLIEMISCSKDLMLTKRFGIFLSQKGLKIWATFIVSLIFSPLWWAIYIYIYIISWCWKQFSLTECWTQICFLSFPSDNQLLKMSVYIVASGPKPKRKINPKWIKSTIKIKNQ